MTVLGRDGTGAFGIANKRAGNSGRNVQALIVKAPATPICTNQRRRQHGTADPGHIELRGVQCEGRAQFRAWNQFMPCCWSVKDMSLRARSSPQFNQLNLRCLLGDTRRSNVAGCGQESYRFLDDISRHRLLGCLFLVDAPDFSQTELSSETAW